MGSVLLIKSYVYVSGNVVQKSIHLRLFERVTNFISLLAAVKLDLVHTYRPIPTQYTYTHMHPSELQQVLLIVGNSIRDEPVVTICPFSLDICLSIAIDQSAHRLASQVTYNEEYVTVIPAHSSLSCATGNCLLPITTTK